MMNKTDMPLRMPAEWESSAAVLVAWPHGDTDWAYMLNEVEECYVNLIKAICHHAHVIIALPDATRAKVLLTELPDDKITFLEVPTNDTWTRDYGVITTVTIDGSTILNDFGFNAWGGKFAFEKDNNVTRFMVDKGLLRGRYADYNAFILEGGSIESDGKGVIMTTSSCLLTDTRNQTMAAIGSKKPYEDYLAKVLGAKKVLWLDNGHLDGDDTDGHIDTLARLAPNDTILYCGAGTEDDEQASSLKAMKSDIEKFRTLDDKPYRLIELPMPDPIYDEDGLRLPATYANYLVVNRVVLVPVYAQPAHDIAAVEAIRSAFPEYEIETVDCRALIRQHGSLHCATMQIPPYAYNNE